jgi:hypothetical protein
MNEEIGTEAAQFPEKAYTNGFFVCSVGLFYCLTLSGVTLFHGSHLGVD